MKGFFAFTFLALVCSAMGECPQTACDNEGETMAYNDPAQCSQLYCTCTGGEWVESTCNGSAVYNPDVMECDDEVNMPACAASTTDEPATTTDEPATTTDEPATTTDEPATTTDEPATTTDEPATTTDEPATTTDEPATTTDEPATTTDEPATTTDEPATTTDEPATTTDEPATTTDEPATTTDEPATTTDELATTTDEPTTTLPPISCPQDPCQDGDSVEYEVCNDLYCYCDNGSYGEAACEEGTVYDPDAADCVLPEYSDDCTNPENTCPTEQCSNPGEVEESVYGCSPLYCVCQDNGGYDVQNCAPGLVYNPDAGYCDNTAPSCESNETP